MRRGKKFAWILIAGLLIISLISGAAWIGDKPVSAEISEQAKGRLVHLNEGNSKITVAYEGTEKTYSLATDVWVYRNSQKAAMSELKQGDTLDIIFNSKGQAAYIKAVDGSSVAEAAPAAPSPTLSVPMVPQTVTKQDSSKESVPSADVNAGISAVPQVPQSSAGIASSKAVQKDLNAWPWRELELELKSQNLKMKLEHEAKDQDTEAEIYIEMKDRAVVHLKGTEAEQLLLLMMQGLPKDKVAWEQALKQRLAAEFKLQDVSSAKWELDVEWKGDASSVDLPPAERPNLEPKSKEKEHGNGKERGKKHDQQDDDNDNDDDDDDDDHDDD
ncbi:MULTISPECIES: hypothetical protein [unclassified Paenibacillus]|uniref:hypothetical protein n=1 Tax=unclassified Paenibacillus TaxID=185978 RepID=UPI001AE5A266|nr:MULTISPECIES: hypothetical protein [unclassified Paenibacillus]MBP1153400.1 Cu/Ag efflux protein CusF [Paenibacillus sp. PvP091]MBP1171217.1 Cu/Ag efflux protein CusF [Paenibacillus sp. PvR098]MBP2442245.1 Cu/Ag efflux protein CusF [Paenibacillus sp. PvP052]